MSDNKKYYYLKLKENYFDQDHVRVIEAMDNGHTYSLILLKLYLKALKYDGQLKINEVVPYSKSDISILASVLNHDVDHVKEAIRLGVKFKIVEIINTEEIFMSDIHNLIGHASTEAIRKAEYRKKITDKNGTMSQKIPPELESELESELELELENNKVKKESKFPFPDDLENPLNYKNYKELTERYNKTQLWIDDNYQKPGYIEPNHIMLRGESRLVVLRSQELEKMFDEIGCGKTLELIDKLDLYLLDHPEKQWGKKNGYRSHYRTMMNWNKKDNGDKR